MNICCRFLTGQVRTRTCAAFAVLGLVFASSVDAAPMLSAIAGQGGAGATELSPCDPVGGLVTSDGASVFTQATCGPTAFGAGSASARASIGSLGAEARVLHTGFGTGVNMGGIATYSDTFVISGPGDGLVPVRMNLHFAGSLSAGDSAVSNAIITAIIDREFAARTIVIVRDGAPDCHDIFPGVPFTGLGACGFSYNTTLQSAFVNVPQDVPVSFMLELDVSAGSSGNGTSATSLFSDTLGFVIGGPVFEFGLPGDFTANSPTSFIFNNQFLPPSTDVPEPTGGMAMLTGVGLIGLTMLRRRAARSG